MIFIEKAIRLISSQIEWVEKLIIIEQGALQCPFYTKVVEQQKLKWIGEQIELVELLYALHETGCFGKVLIKRLFTISGDFFDCDITNYYNLFGSIKNRVKGERTLFIDKIKRGLTLKMEKADAKPSRK